MPTKQDKQIEKEQKEIRTKELNHPKYWCENCRKLYPEIEVIHTGVGRMCNKCGASLKEK